MVEVFKLVWCFK